MNEKQKEFFKKLSALLEEYEADLAEVGSDSAYGFVEVEFTDGTTIPLLEGLDDVLTANN